MNAALWNTWFYWPMPDATTYEQFAAARRRLWEQQDLDFDLEQLKEFEDLEKHFADAPELGPLFADIKQILMARVNNARL